MYGELINKHALAHNLRPDIVACIILQESKGDTFAWRWEEKFYQNRLYGRTRSQLSGWTPPLNSLPSLADELLQRSCSYGLMQVLGESGRSIAKVDTPFLTSLCDPDRGIDAGCRILSFYLGRANGDYEKALIGYNGSPTYPILIFERLKNKEHLQLLRDN